MKDTTSDIKQPSPGSREAIAKGCTCPVLDNAHGKGYMGVAGVFVYTAGCPLHGQPTNRKNRQVNRF